MGLLDKVKNQAATATAMAKDAAQKGQAKIDSLQANRAADALLRDLGAIVYAERTGRASAGSDADAERLVASLTAHEREHGPIDLGPESNAGGGHDGATASTDPPPPPPTAQPV
jgi:hypothetical protein